MLLQTAAARAGPSESPTPDRVCSGPPGPGQARPGLGRVSGRPGEAREAAERERPSSARARGVAAPRRSVGDTELERLQNAGSSRRCENARPCISPGARPRGVAAPRGPRSRLRIWRRLRRRLRREAEGRAPIAPLPTLAVRRRPGEGPHHDGLGSSARTLLATARTRPTDADAGPWGCSEPARPVWRRDWLRPAPAAGRRQDSLARRVSEWAACGASRGWPLA